MNIPTVSPFSFRTFLCSLLCIVTSAVSVHAEDARKLLFMGDSMTGWMAERVCAYGEANGFEVATIVWDGSTIRKWGECAPKISEYVEQIDPDAVFICLGLNESAEKHPEANLDSALSAIIDAVGERDIVWVGPPTWPGKDYGEPLNSWLAGKLGDSRYFDSQSLVLPRQSATNPHPSREGMNAWADALMEWVPLNSSVNLPGTKRPETDHKRGPVFIYRKMKDQL